MRPYEQGATVSEMETVQQEGMWVVPVDSKEPEGVELLQKMQQLTAAGEIRCGRVTAEDLSVVRQAGAWEVEQFIPTYTPWAVYVPITAYN